MSSSPTAASFDSQVSVNDVEAVMHRAIQLADDNHDGFLSVAEMQEVAGELGLPASAVAVAIAEMHAGSATPNRLLDRVVGPDRVAVHHRTSMSAEETEQLVAIWFKNGHGLRVLTAADGVVVGRKRRDALAPAVRVTRSLQGLGGLGKAREIRAVVVPFAEGRSAMVLVADVSDRRSTSVLLGGVAAAVGIAASGAAAVSVAPAAAMAAPVAVGAGAIFSRVRHRRALAAVAEELEFTADGIAMGSKPPSLVRSQGARLRGVWPRRDD